MVRISNHYQVCHPNQWRTQDSSGVWAKSTHAQAICLPLVMENVYACKLTHAMRALTLEATQIWCLLQTEARARAQGRRALGPPLNYLMLDKWCKTLVIMWAYGS